MAPFMRPEVVVAQPRASVPADVVEAAQVAVLGANHDHALAGDIDCDEVAWLVQALGATGVKPVAGKDPLTLEIEDLNRVVIASGQRGSLP